MRELIAELKGELGARRLPVVATGGYAALIASGLPQISAVKPQLTLEGLRLAWERREVDGDKGGISYGFNVYSLTSMADVGGGKYFPTRSFDELVTAFKTALSEMLSVNSVFASVSLPISVNTEGTYLNQVYIGMFRPDADALPRWPGNLKQYKLGLVSGDIKLLDDADAGAINASTGFITECARSFWTPSTDDTYWSTQPQGACRTVMPILLTTGTYR